MHIKSKNMYLKYLLLFIKNWKKGVTRTIVGGCENINYMSSGL